MPIVHDSTEQERRRQKAAYHREYNKKHRARITERNRIWRDKHRDIFRIRMCVRRQWRFVTEWERVHATERRHHLKKKYGLGKQAYDALLENQKGVCAVCEKPESRQKRSRYLCVDHEHGTAPLKIRGLLCHGCNTALGCVHDDVQTLLKMIAYLEKHAPEKK